MSGYYNRNNRGITKKLGPVTAYADAVLAGYTGTREQWAQDMAKLGQNVTQVAQNTKLTTELAEQTRENTEQVAKDTADVRRLAEETSDNAVQVASNTAESNRLAGETKQAAAKAKEDAEYAGAAADNFRVDTTLSEAGKAAEAKATGEKFAQLSEEIYALNEEIIGVVEDENRFLTPSVSLFNKYDITDGRYKSTTGEDFVSEDYYYTGKIDVTGIEKIASPIGIRFITAYIGDDVIEDAGANNSSYDTPFIYTVPENITSIVVTFNKTVAPKESAFLFDYKGVMIDSPPKYRAIRKESLNDGRSSANKMTIPDVICGNVFELPENHIHKNKQINFYCDIEGDFRDIRVGHGRRIYNGNYIQITPTEYIVYGYRNTDVEIARDNHGLNIKDFISISITCGAEKKTSILIVTNGGTLELNDIEWTGNNGKPFVNWWSDIEPLPTLTNGVFTFNSSDYSKPIYAFGDSYLNTWDNERYGYYVKTRGIDAWLIDGYPGRNSASAIESFRNAMKNGNPKYVLWLLGMNDADDDGIMNASWKTCVDEVVVYCREHNIEPIFATIPNVPNIRNDRKNLYITNILKCRYIDFAKAVGGDYVGSEWFIGFLSGDNVHPTEQGAKALANRLFLDFPEILNQN